MAKIVKKKNVSVRYYTKPKDYLYMALVHILCAVSVICIMIPLIYVVAASFSSPSPGWSIQRRNCVWSSPGTSVCRNLPMSSLICRLSIVCGLYPGYAFINKTAWRGATPTRQRFFSYFFGRRLRTGVFGARFQTKRARSVSSRRSWLRAAVMWRSTVLTLRLSRSAISLLESSS